MPSDFFFPFRLGVALIGWLGLDDHVFLGDELRIFTVFSLGNLIGAHFVEG